MKGFGPSSYGDAFADVYDEWYGDVSDVDATVATLRRLGGQGTYLELGVGTGRIALALRAAGARVVGIDSSSAMLERLRTKMSTRGDAELLPGTIDVIEGDMVDDLPDGPFSVVYIAYNTFFSLGSLDAQRRLFVHVASRLGQDAAFVLEAAVPDVGRPSGDTVRVRTLEADRVVLSIDVHDPASHVVEGQFVEFTQASGVRLRPWRIRYCTTAELDDMARSAGLVLRERWENMNCDPFTPDSPGHVSVYVRSDEGKTTFPSPILNSP